jgi:hypothetical protein
MSNLSRYNRVKKPLKSSLVVQSELYPPVDEVIRDNIAMTSLLKLENLDNGSPLLPPDSPDAISRDRGL